jgi:hypothetical protein
MKLAVTSIGNKHYIYPKVMQIDNALKDFTDPQYNIPEDEIFETALRNGDFIKFNSLDDANWFIENADSFYPAFYAEGGKFNVIPAGALHARLHHMENDEHITKKGIPVVS